MARDSFPRTKDLQPLDAVLRAVIDHHHLWPLLRTQRLLVEWKELVGPTIARVTAPDSLRNGVLSVWVKTSPWMQELRLLAPRLIEQLNAALGDPPLVKELRLHFGAARILADDDELARLRRELVRRPPPARLIPRPASAERAAQIADEAAAVEDPELRALISAVRTRHDR